MIRERKLPAVRVCSYVMVCRSVFENNKNYLGIEALTDDQRGVILTC